jgi:nicotinate-nucleotide adenylyltransferase
MKWGLFGGTFDPIHLGHLRCAEEILGLFDLNRIIFVPASRPPHKLQAEISAFQHRAEMIRLAINDNPNFSFSPVEYERHGLSYSVKTVEYILGKYALENLELYFIIGQDAFHAIQTWKDWQRLLLMCHFVVMTRPGYNNRGLLGILPQEFAAKFTYNDRQSGFTGPTGNLIFFREVTFLDIASSRIRCWTAEGKSIHYLVPDAVRHYILKNGLYTKK